MINLVVRSICKLHVDELWDFDFGRRLKRPMIGITSSIVGRTGCGKCHSRVHPICQQLNLSVSELFVLRHLQVLVVMPYGPNQQTAFGFAGDGRRTGISAFQNRLARIQPQSGPLFSGTVALGAMFEKQRTHAGFKLLHRFG